MTALLVCGSAPCLFDDLDAALEKFGAAHIMLVNGACTLLQDAEHVLAGHTYKAEEFAKARREVFPFAVPWRLHASYHPRQYRRTLAKEREWPSVTDWWGPEYSSGATSAGKAIRIGMALGYGPIVLCGAPLDGSGYAPGEAVAVKLVSAEQGCQRVGDERMQQRSTIRRYRDTFKRLAETEWKGKVFSMSGFSRDCLGLPG